MDEINLSMHLPNERATNTNIRFAPIKAHLKPPGTGAPFPMHQDYGYFPFKACGIQIIIAMILISSKACPLFEPLGVCKLR